MGKPRAEILNETTGVEIGKSLVDPNNYDLIYGKPNHLRVKLYPAGSPDVLIQPGGTLILSDSSVFTDDMPREPKAKTLFGR